MVLTLEHTALVVLLAGIAFLLMGLNAASESLQKLAANQIRLILNRLDESGIMGVAVGTLLTLMMQSSGALTATLVNLGSARVLTLVQVMSVLIGSAIGAAMTVQLISFHATALGLPVFLVGFMGSFFTKKHRANTFWEFVMGMGLLFFGLELITMGATSLIAGPEISEAFHSLHSSWLAVLVVSTIMTSVFHSSTATLGIVMGLVSSGAMTTEDALLWIYGANIGTTSMAILASLKANHLGRRIAYANFLYRLASVLIFIPIAHHALAVSENMGLSPSRQIATVYLALTLIAAILFYPLRKFGVQLIERIITPSDSEQEFSVRFLKRSNYDSFPMGLAHAKRELLEMGDIVLQMVELSLETFRDEDPDLVIQIRKLDDRVDLLLKEIKLFLIRVSDQSPEGMNQSVIDVISFGSDLEAAADMIDHHLLDLAQKKRKQHLEFSQEGWVSLRLALELAGRSTNLAMTYFQTEDPKMASELMSLKGEMRDLENRSRVEHIARLSRNSGGETFGISAIYLETMNTYLQLVEMVARHAKRTLKPLPMTQV